jgi:VCBS repeat-containing protein
VLRWLQIGAAAAGVSAALAAGTGHASADTGTAAPSPSKNATSSTASAPDSAAGNAANPRHTGQARRPTSTLSSQGTSAPIGGQRARSASAMHADTDLTIDDAVLRRDSPRAVPAAAPPTASINIGHPAPRPIHPPLPTAIAHPVPVTAAPVTWRAIAADVLAWTGLGKLAPDSPIPADPTPDLIAGLWIGVRKVHYSWFNSYPTATASPAPTQDLHTGVITGTITADDADSDALTFTVVDGPSNGTIKVDDNGAYTYTPDADLAASGGSDSVTVAISDDNSLNPWHIHGLADLLGRTTVTTTIPLTVTAVIAEPTNSAPIAPATLTGVTDTSGHFSAALDASDPDGDSLTYTVTQGQHGTAAVDASGVVSYTTNDGVAHGVAQRQATEPTYQLTDSVTVTITDSHGATTSTLVSVAITPTNSVPTVTVTPGTADPTTGAVVLTVTKTDPDGDPVTVTAATTDGTLTRQTPGDDTTWSYTPSTALSHTGGPAILTFTATDSTGAPATLVTTNLTVAAHNTAPVIDSVGSTPGIGNTWVVSVTNHDTDSDPVTVAVAAADQAAPVTATKQANGTWNVVADPVWAAAHPGMPVTVTVSASDGHGGSAQRTVDIGTANNAVNVGVTSAGLGDIPALAAGVTYTQAAAGDYHTVLLRSDGTAIAIGSDTYHQTEIPALPSGLTYTQIAAGDYHTVLLRSDGTVIAIGNNANGQTTIPAPTGGVTYTQVAAAYAHTVLLRSDGTALTLGTNNFGETNIPALTDALTYTQIAVGRYHTVLLRSDGTVVAVGANTNGATTIPALTGGLTYTQIAAGTYQTVLLRSDGTAVAVGATTNGATAIPALPSGVRYTQVAAAGYETVLLRSDGTAVAIGDNSLHQTEIPALPSGVRYIQAAVGSYHTVLLTAVTSSV